MQFSLLVYHHKHHATPKLFDSLGFDAVLSQLMPLKKLFCFEEPLIAQVTILKLMLLPSVCHHFLIREESFITHITFHNVFFHVFLQTVFVLESSVAMVTSESFMLFSHMNRKISH